MRSAQRMSPPGRQPGGHKTNHQAHSTLDAQEVKDHAAGRWLGILAAVVPQLQPAIAKIGHHVGCPSHGGRDGFRLFKDADETGGGICNTCGPCADGLATIMLFTGWTFLETMREVAEYLGIAQDEPGTYRQAPPRVAPAIATPQPREWAREALERVWSETVSGNHPKAETLRRYLAGRGLLVNPVPEALRFHPALPYHHGKQLVGTYPAMLALVVDREGHPVSIHRTYLTPDGTKATPTLDGEALPAKKLMSPVLEGATRGGAVRLYPAGSAMLAAEGVETTIAVHLDTGLPAWAAVSAGGLEALELPEGVRRLIIAADNDANGTGERAARTLAQRMLAKGLEVEIAMPPTVGMDWADVIARGGPLA